MIPVIAAVAFAGALTAHQGRRLHKTLKARKASKRLPAELRQGAGTNLLDARRAAFRRLPRVERRRIWRASWGKL